MRAQSRYQIVITGLCAGAVFLLLIFTAVHGHSAPPAESLSQPQPCPSPTVGSGGQCRLAGDVVTLRKTLRLPSNTTLDCRGRRLKPIRTGLDLAKRSEPEVGIFLNGVRNVRIINCVIDGFDFGIFAIKSKALPNVRKNADELLRRRILIRGNTINARFAGISLLSVDDTRIINNTVRYTTAGGKGIHVGRDSDLNVISSNRITGDIASATSQAVVAPGPESQSSNPAVPADPTKTAGQAVLITQMLGDDPTLLNAIIEDELFQLDVVNSPCPNEDFSEDNVVANNFISFAQAPFDGVVISIGQRTTVRGNTVRGANLAIRAGIQSGANGLTRTFPGGCTDPAGRLCLADADCNILGTNNGRCRSPDPTTVQVFWVSDSNLIEGNTINGPFNRGIATTGRNTVIRRNRITGVPQGTGTGISLSTKFALETTTVTRNVVSNVEVGILLTNRPTQNPDMPADVFGARVSLNDFIGYTTAVRSDIAATLSADGRGNFWGLKCPQGFDPAKAVRTGDLAPADVLTDDHPFGVPVVTTLFAFFPQPCR